jgi:hypothetical protein
MTSAPQFQGPSFYAIVIYGLPHTVGVPLLMADTPGCHFHLKLGDARLTFGSSS